MNIARNLENGALLFPDSPVVIEGDKSTSFSELNKDANHIASALVSLGVRPGEHVALCAPNSYEWLAFYFGVLKTGSVAVTFSHLMRKDELSGVLDDCKPKILFTTDEKLEDLQDYRDRPCPEMIVCDCGDLSYDRLVEKGAPEFKIIDRDRHDTAVILYTGGTTGIPKGAMLTQQNLQTSTFNAAYYERSSEKDLALCFLPLNHVFAQVHIMHSTVFAGGGDCFAVGS